MNGMLSMLLGKLNYYSAPKQQAEDYSNRINQCHIILSQY